MAFSEIGNCFSLYYKRYLQLFIWTVYQYIYIKQYLKIVQILFHCRSLCMAGANTLWDVCVNNRMAGTTWQREVCLAVGSFSLGWYSGRARQMAHLTHTKTATHLIWDTRIKTHSTPLAEPLGICQVRTNWWQDGDRWIHWGETNNAFNSISNVLQHDANGIRDLSMTGNLSIEQQSCNTSITQDKMKSI